MKIPLSWIREFVDMEASPQEIARVLTLQGLEVDVEEARPTLFSKVVVASVIAVQPHPNADKLQVATVFDGEGEHTVVCGAPNCRVGIKSAFARIGAEIGEGTSRFKIKKTKLRGVESCGMLCSFKELGLGDEESGIIEFAAHMKEGTDLSDLYADYLFEIGLTPNLSHCLSVRGVAREIAACFSKPIKRADLGSMPASLGHSKITVEIQDRVLCPSYKWVVIEGVSVKESPNWLKNKLEASGIRPINFVVDVTNYVMIEEGQPLHAFDLDKIKGEKIEVRAAKPDEKLITLDGKERTLMGSEIVIADTSGPIALAGVMGGQSTEVDANTKRVLIESALFYESAIRKASKKEMLYTEASRRFERGIDPNRIEAALLKAATLIVELSSGSSMSTIGVVGETVFPLKKVNLRLSQVNRLLGTQFSIHEVENLLKRLDFVLHFENSDLIIVTIPSYRNDISQEVDLIEEVARLFGYHNLPRQKPRFHGSQELSSPLYLFEREIKEKLVREGLQEFVSCDLMGPDLLEKLSGLKEPGKESIALLNPVSRDHSYLRNSLLGPLLNAVKTNMDRESPDIAAFEVGRAHIKREDRYEEPLLLGIVLSGRAHPHDFAEKPSDFSFRDLRGLLDNLFEAIGIDKVVVHPAKNPLLHPGRQASLSVQGQDMGSFGEVHPAILRRFDIDQRVFYAELSLDDLLRLKKTEQMLQPIIPFPSSIRDWTCVLWEEAPVSQVVDALTSIPSKLLEKVYLDKLFRKPGAGPRKNATFRFVYRDKEKTIEQEEVEKEHARLLLAVEGLIAGCLAP